MDRDFIPLHGMATDLEDGPLPDSSLEWISNRDGTLGTGRRIDASHLSVGEHQITLRAKDGAGKPAIDTIPIIVETEPLRLYLIEADAAPVCNANTSHFVSLRWRDSGRRPLSQVGPLLLVDAGGGSETFNGAFPIEGSLVLPLSRPLGGLVELHLQARGADGVPTSAGATVHLRPCAGGQARLEEPRGREGWCCIHDEVVPMMAEYCTEEGGTYFSDPGTARSVCRR
jgi:hypothetical protein